MRARGSLRLLPAAMLVACGGDSAGLVVDPGIAALAGTYVNAVGMACVHEKLTLEPDGSFARSSIGQSSLRYTGTASLEGDMLVLHGLPDDTQLVQEIERLDYNRLHVVRWGERVYLITEFSMPMFCDAVNSGVEPGNDGPIGWVLLRDGDWLRDAPGLPSVPDAWSGRILSRDLAGTIIQVVDDAGWVNIGANDGLGVGIKLFVRDVPTGDRLVELGAPPTRDHQVEVIELEAERCLVLPSSGGPNLEAGMRVTSRIIER